MFVLITIINTIITQLYFLMSYNVTKKNNTMVKR